MTKNLPFSIPNPLNPEDADRLFLQIKQALQKNLQVLKPIFHRRFGKTHDWKLFRSDIAFGENGDVLDLVFELEKETPQKFLLVDLSIPFLGKGQKYTLDAKVNQFRTEYNIPQTRVKKAILLIRKGNESVSFASSRLQCPILELSLGRLFGGAEEERERPAAGKKETFSGDLLASLKEAIVHECLSTLAKRRNKYVRRGLWRWLEREILDPNVHFFLIILSSIYQGKTSDVLSRTFTTCDHFSKQPEQIIDRLFSNETCLAPEIVKNGERHRKALRKFLECFAGTPPYEYLRSLFLKEFRSTRDSIKARVAVFNTLKELLARCGFQGEKEVQYPLEILDELGIFQGLMMGSYEQLRVENATKKLQQLVPDRPWNSDEVYKLRDELANLLHLPPSEFNLNAFLPQTFSQLETTRGRGRTSQATARSKSSDGDFEGFEEGVVPANQIPSAAVVRRAEAANLARRQAVPQDPPPSAELPPPGADPAGEVLEDWVPEIPAAMPVQRPLPLVPSEEALTPAAATSNGNNIPSTPVGAPPPLPVVPRAITAPGAPSSQPNTAAPHPLPPVPPAAQRPPAPAPQAQRQQPPQPGQRGPSQGHSQGRPDQRPPMQGGQRPGGMPPQPRPTPPMGQPNQQRMAPRPLAKELDEARHRFFENFGGHLEEDSEAIQFALEIDKAPPAKPPQQAQPIEDLDSGMEQAPRKRPRPAVGEPTKPHFTQVYDPSAPRPAPRRNSANRRRSKSGKRNRNQSGPRNPPPNP